MSDSARSSCAGRCSPRGDGIEDDDDWKKGLYEFWCAVVRSGDETGDMVAPLLLSTPTREARSGTWLPLTLTRPGPDSARARAAAVLPAFDSEKPCDGTCESAERNERRDPPDCADVVERVPADDEWSVLRAAGGDICELAMALMSESISERPDEPLETRDSAESVLCLLVRRRSPFWAGVGSIWRACLRLPAAATSPLVGGALSASSGGRRKGKTKVNLEPLPSFDSTWSWPSRLRTMRATTARPSPTACSGSVSSSRCLSPMVEICSNWRNRFSSLRSEMPLPVSVTEMPMRIESFFSSSASSRFWSAISPHSTRMPPSCVCLSALPTTLATIWRILARSPMSVGGVPVGVSTSSSERPRRAASSRCIEMASSSVSDRLNGSVRNSSLPFSVRVRSWRGKGEGAKERASARRSRNGEERRDEEREGTHEEVVDDVDERLGGGVAAHEVVAHLADDGPVQGELEVVDDGVERRAHCESEHQRVLERHKLRRKRKQDAPSWLALARRRLVSWLAASALSFSLQTAMNLPASV